MLLEHFPTPQRHRPHGREGDIGLRIQVQPQLIGVIHIRHAHGPGVEIEAVEVDHPQDVADVTRHEQIGRTSRREADRSVLVLGPFAGLRGTLLEERLSRDAFRPTFENGGPAGDATQGSLGAAKVVLGHLQLRPTLVGK